VSTAGFQAEARRALEHVRYLSGIVGGRGSCTPGERQAAEYTAEQMRSMGVQQVRLEPYQGSASTYRPYVLAFSAALLGAVISWMGDGREWMALAASLNGLGAWGMLLETDFSLNWMRRLLPRRPSQNALGIIPAGIQSRRKAVLSAHVDTHRTPVFYASSTWRSLFGQLVSLAFLSLAACSFSRAICSGDMWAYISRVFRLRPT